MNKEDMVHIYNGILLCHKKEQNNTRCSNMDETIDYHTKQKINILTIKELSNINLLSSSGITQNKIKQKKQQHGPKKQLDETQPSCK